MNCEEMDDAYSRVEMGPQLICDSLRQPCLYKEINSPAVTQLFCQPLIYPPYKEATCRPDPRKMGRSDPIRKMNFRLSDSQVRGLIRYRGLGYFVGQAKRPFIIPIPLCYLLSVH